MKLRYIIENRGYYIPQYFSKENKWCDFLAKDITGQLQEIVYALGMNSVYSGNIWHFSSTDVNERSVFFNTELKVCAFLGAAKVFFSNRIKEFEP